MRPGINSANGSMVASAAGVQRALLEGIDCDLSSINLFAKFANAFLGFIQQLGELAFGHRGFDLTGKRTVRLSRVGKLVSTWRIAIVQVIEGLGVKQSCVLECLLVSCG